MSAAPISTARSTTIHHGTHTSRSTRQRIAAAAVSAALLLTAGGLPVATADQPGRSGDPSIGSSQLTPAQQLREVAKAARAQYGRAVGEAKAARTEALAAPRAQRKAALASARTKAERRLIRRAYTKATAPIRAEYRSAKRAAAATRDAVIDEALAEYLVATGKPEVVAALEDYRSATAVAGNTLELALKSGRETFRTDTADERAQLVADLEQAESQAERTEAWKDFVAATAGEVAAHTASIAAARAAYRSALAKARDEFKLDTGQSIKALLKLPFKV